MGLEAARCLLEHGCSGVALLDINPVATTALTDQLAADFPEARIVTKEVDITDHESVDKVFSDVRKLLGTIDILLCFAGVSNSVTSLDTSIEHFRKTLEINTTGSFICAQLAARYSFSVSYRVCHVL